MCVSESETSLDDSRADAAAVAQPPLGKHGDVGVLSENEDIFSPTVRLRTFVTQELLVRPSEQYRLTTFYVIINTVSNVIMVTRILFFTT